MQPNERELDSFFFPVFYLNLTEINGVAQPSQEFRLEEETASFKADRALKNRSSLWLLK